MRVRFSLKLLLIVMAFFALYFFSLHYIMDLAIKRNREGQRFILEGKKASLEQEIVRIDNYLPRNNEYPQPVKSPRHRIQFPQPNEVEKDFVHKQWKLRMKQQAKQELEVVEVELDDFLGVDPLEKAAAEK
jgi:hypothetical protein